MSTSYFHGDALEFLHAFQRFCLYFHSLVRSLAKSTDHCRQICPGGIAALIDIKVNLVKNRIWVHEINQRGLDLFL